MCAKWNQEKGFAPEVITRGLERIRRINSSGRVEFERFIFQDYLTVLQSMVVFSDEIPEVYYHSHRVLVMRSGRLSGEFVPGRCSEEELKEAVNA